MGRKIEYCETSCCQECGCDPGGRRLLKVPEAAGFYQIHRNTVFRWMKLNLVEVVITPGGTRRIYEDSLIRENPPKSSTLDGSPPGDRTPKQMDLEQCHVCGAPVKHSRELITIRTAMEIALVSRSTVQRWISDGKVKSVKLPSGSPRIYLDSLFDDPILPKEAYATEAYCGAF